MIILAKKLFIKDTYHRTPANDFIHILSRFHPGNGYLVLYFLNIYLLFHVGPRQKTKNYKLEYFILEEDTKNKIAKV